MSLQHIQKNSPRLLPKPAKFEKNPPNGYRVIRKTKCLKVSHTQTSVPQGTLNKGDGIHQSFSNNIINAPHISYVYLALLFNSMLVHGVIPDGMLLGTIIPIVKNKRKSTCVSSNFRAITLSSILGKMFDNIILAQNSSIFSSSDYQFGFKPKHSTVNWSFVLKEIAQYYNNKGSNVYCLLLDASQAFDRVHYIKLFKLLIDKGMCFLTARFLLSSYIEQHLRVKWEDIVSTEFSVKNSVKQGGVLSPILFAIYIDELLNRLNMAGYGCYICPCSTKRLSPDPVGDP